MNLNEYFSFVCFILLILIIATINKNYFYYEYNTELIILNNTSINKYNVYKYLCDDGVYIHHSIFSNKYYFSTWEDAKIHYGRCFIKYKIKKYIWECKK